MEVLQKIVDWKVDVNHQDKEGKTPLFYLISLLADLEKSRLIVSEFHRKTHHSFNNYLSQNLEEDKTPLDTLHKAGANLSLKDNK